MVINAHARSTTDRLVVPVGRGLVRLGVSPNMLTTFGVAGTFVGAGVVAAGHPLAGGIVLAVATATDALDGTVARLLDQVSRWGSFYDSVADRISDVVLFGAALWLVQDDPLLFMVALVGLAGALLTSYIRAKAESLGWTATVGLLERPERVIILILGLGLQLLPLSLWLLAIGGFVTVAQRVRVVFRQAAAE